MADFLLHQNRDGTPVGVWQSPTEFSYAPDAQHKVSYGKAVVANQGHEQSWEGFIEQLASKFPSPYDQWEIYQTDGTLELSEVLDEARENAASGGVRDELPVVTSLWRGVLSRTDRETWLNNYGFPDDTSDEDILMAMGSGFG